MSKYNEGLKLKTSELLIEAREARGLSQEELAKRIGAYQSNVARAERDDYLPGLQYLMRVADALGYEIQIDFKRRKYESDTTESEV